MSSGCPMVADPTGTHSSSELGFSLFESMIALAVFSLAALSCLTLITQNTRSASYLEARNLAGFVAENLMVETRLETILNTSDTAGTAQMAGKSFEWERLVSGTGEGGLKRITIRVREEEGSQTLAVLNGFWNG